ncbi:hypothetical protein FACS189447_01710 [Spirochaetia bacterium]|nr:hypothetical protein FACS189447_01710 [Spirochaetia bacterium]
MKRSEALVEIKIAGWNNEPGKVAGIAVQKGIGKAAARKAFLDGQKMKERGEPCPEGAKGK